MKATKRSSQTIDIFVVDDHAIVRDGLKLLVESQGDMKVCGEAGTPAEARRAIRKAKPDIVVADLKYDQGSGLELVKELKTRYPDIKILVLSMHEESAYAERALRAGANGYIMKSVLRGSLLEAIREIMAGHIYLSERMKETVLHRVASGEESTQKSTVHDLSDRELQVFDLLGGGMSSQEAADQLGLSVRTVHTHRERIKQKLGLGSGAELVQRAVSWVLTSEDE